MFSLTQKTYYCNASTIEPAIIMRLWHKARSGREVQFRDCVFVTGIERVPTTQTPHTAQWLARGGRQILQLLQPTQCIK